MRQIAIMVTAAMLFLAAVAAEAASLRAEVTVDDSQIRLGDLFAGLEGVHAATAVIGPAPAPGRRAVYDAAYLYRVAQAYRLPWRPQSPYDRVAVTRASTRIDAGMIRRALEPELIRALAAQRVEIELDQPSLEVHLPGHQPATVAVRRLEVDAARQRFAADIAVPADGPDAQRLTVTGRAVPVMEVPVLVRRLRRGEVVTAADVGWIEVRQDSVRTPVATDADQLLGQALRRPVAPNVPVPLRDLQAPVVVAKNALVTMVLQTPTMVLTAQGRALQDGAAGDVIRVMNTDSKRVVDAVVAASNLVQVYAAGAAPLN